MTAQETKPAKAEAGIAIGPLEAELAWLVRGLEAIRRLRTYPLERAHYLLIRLVEEEGPQPIGEIARLLLLDDSTVTRQVAAMVEAGLVGKQTNPADGRSSLVAVLPAGREKAEAMRRERLARIENLFREWSEAERLDAARLIARLNRTLRETIADEQDES
jgi:DNA-binding MarR family transcriptional regulator